MILSKYFSRQIECRTDKLAGNFLTQTWKISVWKPKMIVIIYILSKSFVSWKKIHWHIDFSFDNPDGRFKSEIQKFFAQTPKVVNQLKILLKTFFSSIWSSGHLKISSKEPAEKMSPKSPKSFRSRIEIAFSIKTPLKSNFHPKIASAARWLQILRPCRNVFNENKKNRSESDVDIKSAIISKTLFSSESGYLNLRTVLPTVPEFCR